MGGETAPGSCSMQHMSRARANVPNNVPRQLLKAVYSTTCSELLPVAILAFYCWINNAASIPINPWLPCQGLPSTSR
jgi:hypothetical protein